MKTKLIKALKFTACMLPIAIVAGISVAYYQLGNGMAGAIAEQLPISTILLVSAVQTVIYAAFAGMLGYMLADALGLVRSFRFTKKPVLTTLVAGAISGIAFFVLDYVVFSAIMPQVADIYRATVPSVMEVLAKLFYGGVIEELLMRWFVMSLIALVLWKLFARKHDKSSIPAWVFVTANALAALLFALGHLPATLVLFGKLDFMILLRCLLLNGSFGLVFGWLYKKHGIQYAMLAHALTHVFCLIPLYIAIA